MSVDGSLLIDFANALDVADITRVLTEQKTWVSPHELPFLLWPAPVPGPGIRLICHWSRQTISPIVLSGDWRFAGYDGARYCGHRHR